MTRMWINQPSALQRFHEMHGRQVLAGPVDGDGMRQVYFTSGDVVSMMLPNEVLSRGWRLV